MRVSKQGPTAIGGAISQTEGSREGANLNVEVVLLAAERTGVSVFIKQSAHGASSEMLAKTGAARSTGTSEPARGGNLSAGSRDPVSGRQWCRSLDFVTSLTRLRLSEAGTPICGQVVAAYRFPHPLTANANEINKILWIRDRII